MTNERDPRPPPAVGLPTGAPVLEVEDLHVNFAGRVGLIAGLRGKKATDARAVDGVDLEVRKGEVLALAGESGCGKTTTARAIMGLQAPDGGEIGSRASRSHGNLKPYRRKVQMVFQDPTATLNPRQTIYEIVAEGLRIHGITEARTARPRSSWWRGRSRAPGCGRPSASSCSTRTSSPAASGSAS